MPRLALQDWLNEASGEVAGGQAPAMTPDSMPGGAPAGDPNAANPPTGVAPDLPSTQQNSPEAAKQGAPEAQKSNEMPDVSGDPQTPDMPAKTDKKDFEQWKNDYFKECVKGDVNKLVEMIQQVRDDNLESYPRKFVEDNLQICFLRQNANIDKAAKNIRSSIKQELDHNNPSVSIVNHVASALQATPELNSVFIKLKGLLGMKGDLHRKYVASLLGAVQVGSGGNNEDLIYNEKDYSVRLSTRFNDKWGRVDIGKWSLREDDPERFLTEPERRRMEEGSPEEKDVLRRRVVMESIAEAFKKRSFVINVVAQNGTIYTVGWDLSGSIKNAYTSGKLVVRTIESDNNEAMIDEDGKIIPYVDIKVKYLKNGQGTDENGNPVKEEHDFMERIDGILFLTAQFNILKEAASAFSGISLKETPYNGNPSDLNVLMRCVPNASEILLRQC